MAMLQLVGRFFTGSAAGACIDIVVATVLIFFTIPLEWACIASFACAFVVTYWVHLRWTFKLHGLTFFSLSLLKFGGSSLLTLAVRLGIIFFAKQYIPSIQTAAHITILVFAIAVSFCLNFLLAYFWSFVAPKPL